MTYQIEIVIVGKGINYHETKREDNLEFDHAFNDVTYKVQPSNLFIIPRNPVTRFFDRFRHIEKRFMVIFKQGQQEAVGLKDLDGTKPTAQLLRVAKTSGTLKSAMRELFATHFEPKIILFLGIIIIVGVVVFLVATGKIDLGMLT